MAMPELTQKNVQDTLCEKKAGYESVWIDYNTYARYIYIINSMWKDIQQIVIIPFEYRIMSVFHFLTRHHLG